MICSGIFNRRLEQKGESPPDTWTFAILEESSPDIIWRGQVMSKNTIVVYPPGAEIDAYSPSGFHVLTISIPTNPPFGSHLLQIVGAAETQVTIKEVKLIIDYPFKTYLPIILK